MTYLHRLPNSLQSQVASYLTSKEQVYYGSTSKFFRETIPLSRLRISAKKSHDQRIDVLTKKAHQLVEVTIKSNNRAFHRIAHCSSPFPKLRKLSIISTEVTSTGVTSFKLFKNLLQLSPNLCRLDVWGRIRFSNKRLESLSVERLRDLDLSYSPRIKDSTLRTLLQHQKNFRSLNLSGNKKVSDQSIEALAKGNPNLKEISLRGCTNLSSNAIQALANSCHFIKKAWLSNLHLVEEFPLIQFIENNPNLVTLDLSRYSAVSDNVLQAIANHCRSLRNLRLSRCQGITDLGVQEIATKCSNLEVVYLSHCSQLTHQGIASFASCQRLSILRISHCTNTHDSSVAQIAMHCSFLTEISLEGCINLTDASLHALHHHCLHLSKVHLSTTANFTEEGMRDILPRLTFQA